MNRIYVHEYPKSGGSWLVNLLSDLTALPAKDLYVGPGFNAFDIQRHPWYLEQADLSLPADCVVKSHEQAGSALTPGGRHVHLIRDGRDVVVSKYCFEKDFCVKNGIYQSFDMDFTPYVAQTALQWRQFIDSWQHAQNVVWVRYEDLLQSPQATLQQLLEQLDIAAVVTPTQALANHSIANMRKALDPVFHSNTFVRKGVRGDWQHYFGTADKTVFKQQAGTLLLELDYEQHPDW